MTRERTSIAQTMNKDVEDVIGPDNPTTEEASQISCDPFQLHHQTLGASKALCPEKKPEDAGEAMEIILDHAGAMGVYQRWLFVAMLPFGATMAFVYFTSIFTVATPQSHWCRVPELAHLDLELRRNLSAPGATTAGANYEHWDRCQTFVANWSAVLESLQPPTDAPTVPCRHGWDFQLLDVPYNTVVSERGWVCEYGTYVPLTQFTFFGGAFCGGLIFGWMADRVGRVPSLVAANLVGFVGSVACIFTNTHWDFAVCRFIAGLSYDNCFMLVYILILEYVGAQHRTWVANLSIMLYFGGAAILLPWLALWLADWRLLTLLTSLPMLAALAAPLLLPESARWLASRGKHKRAVKMLRRLERVNGTHIPQQALDDFIALSSNRKEDTDESLKAVLTSPRLLILLILNVVLYAACALVFDALVRMSGSVGSDMFVTFAISSATEIPSLLLVVLLLDRIGRRAMATGTLTLIGTLAMIAAFVPKGSPRAWLAISARFFSNMSFNTSIQWVTELLPTGARASGSSLVHVTSFLVSSASPFVVYLEQYWGGLPLVVTSSVALTAAAISLLLPETLGQAMPHSCADAERLITHHSLLGNFLRGPTDKDVEDESNGEEKG